MREMEKSAITTAATGRPPQFSGMFQKLALAVKTKTYEFFAEEDHDGSVAAADSNADGFALLDSAEDFITDQKVVVIKPDKPHSAKTPSPGSPVNDLPTGNLAVERKPNRLKPTQLRKLDAEMGQGLISSVFAAVSSCEASYLQLQSGHAPFVEESVKAADRALVSHLQRLSDLKRFYKDYRQNSDFEHDLAIGSYLESHVQENQSKLRALETVSNRLQAEIDEKDLQVWTLRNKLGEIQKSNSKLSKKLSANARSSTDIQLSVRVFESLLHDACRATQKFTKILIELMGKAGWDLDLAASSVHPDIDYAKKGHNRYALLSYVCLGMFRGFDTKGFGLNEIEEESDACASVSGKTSGASNNNSLRELMQHVSSNPMELLNTDRDCEFSKFCDKKYQELIHPNMESSIFRNMDQTEAVVSSWRSLSIFYESFVNVASSIWSLHKLALSFEPVVEIFQVERGVDFSMVYMEDVLRKHDKKLLPPSPTRAKVGFTVVPGFKIGCTIIQSRVYLNGLKSIYPFVADVDKQEVSSVSEQNDC
ncbi:PREDICTED: IRK-interacting protein-like [Tarenaya hassleriana]|uniref:IRK-interacting protein-like n=1 Tax=Tarenaya hassleriana TaxID=28532 RepID=UPI00053C4EAB|nr:PREDICTED: IRK-interacting protein-like [Tarenaya hassleriana]